MADCPTKLLLNILLKNSKFKLDPFTENRARVTFENRKTIVRSTILYTLGYEDILDANAATITHKPLVHHCELYDIETFQYQSFLIPILIHELCESADTKHQSDTSAFKIYTYTCIYYISVIY